MEEGWVFVRGHIALVVFLDEAAKRKLPLQQSAMAGMHESDCEESCELANAVFGRHNNQQNQTIYFFNLFFNYLFFSFIF